MRVQIELSREVKTAAEAQAAFLGYASLAAMLRVMATGLARDHRTNMAASSATDTAVAATLVATPPTTNPPDPQQFTKWPAHISHDIATTDPDLYRLLIAAGDIA